jgi:NDP-sugar pyrophosphorylase family protein
MTPLPPLALLTGGLATRLRPHTLRVPKAMIEVAGAPFIAHQLRLLRRKDVARVVLCIVADRRRHSTLALGALV